MRPAGVDEPLEWMLLSTLPVTSFEEAKTALARYAKRWGIEIYHRVLKSGCRIEDRQLGSSQASGKLSGDRYGRGVAYSSSHLARS